MKTVIAILLACFLALSCGGLTAAADQFAGAREQMVKNQLAARDITDKKVLKVMGEIPRHQFVPEALRPHAYRDRPLPIGEDQTISQPYIVALMTQTLKLKPTDKVLEIGTGSGYQAAVLSKLVKEVYTIEIVRSLAVTAKNRLASLGFNNVHVKFGDGFDGWPDEAPFDAIMITAAVGFFPPRLIEQLANGGRIVLPLGEAGAHQVLTLATKKSNRLEKQYITGVRFVPMTGKALK